MQIEAGYRLSGDRNLTQSDLGELYVRWGLSPRVELQIGLNSYQIIDRPGDDDPEGFEDPSIGFKLGVGGPQRGARPQMALIVAARPAGR